MLLRNILLLERLLMRAQIKRNTLLRRQTTQHQLTVVPQALRQSCGLTPSLFIPRQVFAPQGSVSLFEVPRARVVDSLPEASLSLNYCPLLSPSPISELEFWLVACIWTKSEKVCGDKYLLSFSSGVFPSSWLIWRIFYVYQMLNGLVVKRKFYECTWLV